MIEVFAHLRYAVSHALILEDVAGGRLTNLGVVRGQLRAVEGHITPPKTLGLRRPWGTAFGLTGRRSAGRRSGRAPPRPRPGSKPYPKTYAFIRSYATSRKFWERRRLYQTALFSRISSAGGVSGRPSRCESITTANSATVGPSKNRRKGNSTWNLLRNWDTSWVASKELPLRSVKK